MHTRNRVQFIKLLLFQPTMKVGFQGIHGAYSEVGVQNYFGKDAVAVGYESFEEVIEALKRKDINTAFLPVENSIMGSITDNCDILLREDVSIIAEHYVQIRHALLALKGSTISSIKEAYSHHAALAQCKDFLRIQGIKGVPFYDTAGAAKMIAEQKNETQAAIASSLCAELYELQILAQDIQSYNGNTTRFFVVVLKENVPKDLERKKTSLAFRTYHTPGALVEALSLFSKHAINMTKLESRPVPDNPWQYTFFVDIEGSVYDSQIMQALTELGLVTPYCKVLGSYPLGKCL